MPLDATGFQGRGGSGRRRPISGADAARSVVARGAAGGFCLWLGLILLPGPGIALGSTAAVLAVLCSYRVGMLRCGSWRIALIEGNLIYVVAACSCNVLTATMGILSAFR